MDFGNFVAAGTDFSQESSSQDPFSQSQDTFTQVNPADGTVLTGEKLLAQPYKVFVIIHYPYHDLDLARNPVHVGHILKSTCILVYVTKDHYIQGSLYQGACKAV